jgi:hypothetical protein
LSDFGVKNELFELPMGIEIHYMGKNWNISGKSSGVRLNWRFGGLKTNSFEAGGDFWV